MRKTIYARILSIILATLILVSDISVFAASEIVEDIVQTESIAQEENTEGEELTEEVTPSEIPEEEVVEEVAPENTEEEETEEAIPETPEEEKTEEITPETPEEEKTEEITPETPGEEKTEEVIPEIQEEESAEEVASEITEEEMIPEESVEDNAEDDGAEKVIYTDEYVYVYGDGKVSYFNKKKTLLKKAWKTISGVKHYFNEEGYLQTGWFKVGSSWYYSDAEPIVEDGKLSFKGGLAKGFKTIDENTYYFNTEYKRVTGFKTISKQRYYFNNDGILQTGWFEVKSKIYYGEEPAIEGEQKIPAGALAKGIREINGEVYCFSAKNYYILKGWQTVNNVKYYLDSSGKAMKGWQTIKGKDYFFNDAGIYMSLAAPTISSVKSSVYETAVVKWKKKAGAAGYVLEYSKNKQFPEEEVNTQIIEDPTTVQAAVDGLDIGEKYYFRVKYYACAGEGENKVTEYSKYSKLQSATVYAGAKATSTSATVSECKIIDIVREEECNEAVEITVRFNANLKEQIKSSDSYYYIVETESYGTELDMEEPVAVVDKQLVIEETFTISGDAARVKQALMNKYAVAIKNTKGTYQVISAPMGITNPEETAENTTAIFKASSKKGLQGVYYADDGSGILDARNANTKQTLFNINIEDRIAKSAQTGFIEFEYKGKTYYFSDFSDLILSVQSLNAGYDQYIYGHNGITKVSVTFCLLLGYDSSKTYLIDSAARSKGHKYYTLNIREEKARETYEAFFYYMGNVFGQEDCYVTNWILGNEVNSSKAWNYSGKLSQSNYMKYYAAAFRLIYNGVKATKNGNNVFISLDNGWTAAPNTYSGKSTLDKFALYAQAENPDMLWSIAYHGYSYPLTRCDFWNDSKYTTNSTSTKYISMKNIAVLTNYAETLEQKYGKPEGSIRVILSEQGYNAGKGAELQAQALARGYYMAEFNDRIDAFIIRAVIDDASEAKGGLYLGILNRYEEKRISFYVYEYMDTDLVQLEQTSAAEISIGNLAKVETAQRILCGTDWESLISGFDRSKLKGMD